MTIIELNPNRICIRSSYRKTANTASLLLGKNVFANRITCIRHSKITQMCGVCPPPHWVDYDFVDRNHKLITAMLPIKRRDVILSPESESISTCCTYTIIVITRLLKSRTTMTPIVRGQQSKRSTEWHVICLFFYFFHYFCRAGNVHRTQNTLTLAVSKTT